MKNIKKYLNQKNKVPDKYREFFAGLQEGAETEVIYGDTDEDDEEEMELITGKKKKKKKEKESEEYEPSIS